MDNNERRLTEMYLKDTEELRKQIEELKRPLGEPCPRSGNRAGDHQAPHDAPCVRRMRCSIR